MNKFVNDIDLTKGNLKRNLLLFTLPFFFANLFNSFYSAIDLIFIGQCADKYNIAAVSAGSTVMFAVNSIILGLATGGTIVIGQLIGAKSKDVGKSIKSFITYMILVTVVATSIMLALFYPMMKWMNLDDNTIGIARNYLLILVLGIPFYTFYHTIGAIFKAKGNSSADFIFIGLTVIINLILDAIFIIDFQWGAVGAALATTLGEMIGALFSLFYLIKVKFGYILPKGLDIDRSLYIDFARCGGPIAIQDGLVIFSFAIILGVISIRGVDFTSAVGITDRVTSFGFAPLSAIGCAISTATAQNMGAKNLDNVKQYVKYGTFMSIIAGVTLFTLMATFSYEFAWIFSGNEVEPRNIADLYIKSTALDLLVCTLVFPLNAVFMGSKHTVFAMSQNLITTFLFRLPIAVLFALPLNLPMFVVGLAYPISTCFSLCMCLWFYKSNRWLKLGNVNQFE